MNRLSRLQGAALRITTTATYNIHLPDAGALAKVIESRFMKITDNGVCGIIFIIGWGVTLLVSASFFYKRHFHEW